MHDVRRLLTENDDKSLLRLLITGMVDAGAVDDLYTGRKGTNKDAIATLETMTAVEVFELMANLVYNVPAYSSAVRVSLLRDPYSCPDCGDDIVRENGVACSNCGHVYWDEED